MEITKLINFKCSNKKIILNTEKKVKTISLGKKIIIIIVSIINPRSGIPISTLV